MSFTLITPQPAPRSSALDYDDVGPGLYAGETALELDTGDLVAVSVESQWLENGAGVAFKSCARWINADGSTRLCPNDCHIETNASHTADAVSVQAHGVAALGKEMLLLVLGEEPTLITIDGEEVPIIGWSADVRLNASIRHALACSAETGTSDPATLLGL